MNSTLLVKIVIMSSGAITLAGSILNLDWFFNNRKAQRIVNLIGRKGARIFYAILGIFIIVLGIFARTN